MENIEDIDLQIWEYLDASCDASSMARIADLIVTNAQWQQRHTEIAAFHKRIAQHCEPDMPSMRFTKNVMDVIVHTDIAPATKTYINRNIVKGIAAFFILLIAGTTIYALSVTDYSNGISNPALPFNIKDLKLVAILNNRFLNILILINVLLGLVLLDSWLRKPRSNKA
ncbi:MAG: hypothetical protein WCG87_09545 [Bacteroidota bacterium]